MIVAEIIRKRIKDLYQVYTLKTLTVEDKWSPRTDDLGLKEIVQKKDLTVMEIKITRKITEEDKKLPGFMDKSPENKEENKTLDQIMEGTRRQDGDRQGGDRQGGYRPRRRDQ